VRIKDPAIAIIRLILITCFIIYFCVWRLGVGRAYDRREQLVGMIQTSLQRPSLLPRTDQLSYCSGGPGTALKVLPCVTGPDAWVMAPSRGGDRLFIATRLKDVSGDGGTSGRSFITEPEDYTVGVTFTVQALNFFHQTGDHKYSQSIQELETRLVDASGTPYTEGVERISRFDVFRLNTLLHAAGISGLDSPHPADPTSSLRYDGLVLIVAINCPMALSGTVMSCDYQVEHIMQSESEKFVVKQLDASKAEGISSQERRGIMIRFEVSGEMGKFDLPTIVLAWVEALVMVGLCTLAIDFAMSNLLPLKDVYKLLLVEETPSIHSLRQGDAKAQRAFKEIQREHRRNSVGYDTSPPNSPKQASRRDSTKKQDSLEVPSLLGKPLSLPVKPSSPLTESPAAAAAAAPLHAQEAPGDLGQSQEEPDPDLHSPRQDGGYLQHATIALRVEEGQESELL